MICIVLESNERKHIHIKRHKYLPASIHNYGGTQVKQFHRKRQNKLIRDQGCIVNVYVNVLFTCHGLRVS